MLSRSGVAWLAAALVLALSLTAYAQDEPATEPRPGGKTTTTPTSNTSESELRRDMFVSLAVVKDFFPEVTRSTFEADATAFGKPVGTRIANYTTNDGSKKISLSVDQYQNPAEALFAYQDTAQKNELAEVNPIAISNVGQQVFANTLAQGKDKRIAITSLDGTLMVTAMLAGYDTTTDNIARLADLARKEVEQAHAHVSARRKR